MNKDIETNQLNKSLEQFKEKNMQLFVNIQELP